MRLFDNRIAYTILLWLLLPYALLHLWWRARKQPEYLHHVAERFGRYDFVLDRPPIWIHTVSVGETRAAVTLIRQLREAYPGHPILLSHTTPTGRAASIQLYGEDVKRVYLPYDYPFAVRRFLRHFKPCVGVLLETEIWFNLIHACKNEKVPLLLLNARLSERSTQKYARFPRLVYQGLRALQLIAAQTDEDAARLSSLSHKAVPVMGNLKFDISPPESLIERGEVLRAWIGTSRPVLLAASTREGEEALILDALQQADIKGLLTIIVPRHPQRFDEVEQQVLDRGLRLQRRTHCDKETCHADTQVLLGDSMGELFAYYAASDVAFIGGSLLPLGGQNLIEASAVGTPVLIGPHTFNFSQAAEQAIASGAALRVQDAEELMRQVMHILSDEELADKMRRCSKQFIESNQGATERALSIISNWL